MTAEIIPFPRRPKECLGCPDQLTGAEVIPLPLTPPAPAQEGKYVAQIDALIGQWSRSQPLRTVKPPPTKTDRTEQSNAAVIVLRAGARDGDPPGSVA